MQQGTEKKIKGKMKKRNAGKLRGKGKGELDRSNEGK